MPKFPNELLGLLVKREDAIVVLKELIDNCAGLDGHSMELTPPTIGAGGYQITIRVALDQETKNCIQTILTKHGLTYQTGSIWKTKRTLNQEPDTFIIYKPKNNLK
jgi:hypothetical protein